MNGVQSIPAMGRCNPTTWNVVSMALEESIERLSMGQNRGQVALLFGKKIFRKILN